MIYKPTYPLPLPEYEQSQEIKDKSELKAAWYNDNFHVIGHRYQYLVICEHCLGLHQISLVTSILQSVANIRAEVETKNINSLFQWELSVCLLNIDKNVVSKEFLNHFLIQYCIWFPLLLEYLANVFQILLKLFY